MSNLIDPRCGAPSFLMDNEGIAAMCGRYGGYIIAGILSLIIVGVSIAKYNSSLGNDVDEKGNPATKKDWRYLIAGGAGLLVIWLVIPWLLGWFSKRSFQTSQIEIDNYMKAGMTRQQALDKMTSIYQSQIQASATRDAGGMVAGALWGSAQNR